ncbi:MAG: glycosyltransferase family 4 protein [Candidatus Aminicenantes bacterium]|nr:MAG: glycosyltransferase family 4 protein [Candidatus Aminicenantes bacterium]
MVNCNNRLLCPRHTAGKKDYEGDKVESSASILHHIKIAHLMADYSLTYNPLFFGQFALLQDFAANWNVLRYNNRNIPVRHYYLGSNVSGAFSKAVPDPTGNNHAYIDTVSQLCEEGLPVFALSHFIHKDSLALLQLCDLKSHFPNLVLLVILHCTRDEFLRPWSDSTPLHNKRSRRQAKRAEDFRFSLSLLAKKGAVDAFIAVSESTKQSYIKMGKTPSISPDLITVIDNGVDVKFYLIPGRGKKAKYRLKYGIPGGMVIGCTNRWTQTKGKDILESLLDHLEREANTFPTTFLFPLIIHDQLFQFIKSIPKRYPRLYEMNRIRGFLDVSKLKISPFKCNLAAIKRKYHSEIQKQAKSILKVFNRISMGFLDHPIYTLLDVYLRPSIAEAFGLSIVEAYFCGIPVLGSNRGGCGQLILPEHQVYYTSDINLHSCSENPANQAYLKAINQVSEAFFKLLTMTARAPLPARILRTRMIRAGYSTRKMIGRYNRFLRRFL